MDQSGEELIAEVGAKVSAAAPLSPSAELNSRFQTSNSSALQTMRKSNAQSLFRELHKIKGLKKIEPTKVQEKFDSIDDLLESEDLNIKFRVSNIKRGDLIEIKLRLSASFIFQMSTMIAEFSEMFDESPLFFMNQVRFSDVYQARNANKIITKLLAGLIPIDGVATDYFVIDYNNECYIIHNDALDTSGLNGLPLKVVGVTEHLAYWKDIRRILFADNEFTMLCRVAKPGLQTEWNPIKVADIFREFAPDLALQVEAASRSAMTQSASTSRPSVEPRITHLVLALQSYKDALIMNKKLIPTTNQSQKMNNFIAQMNFTNTSAEAQREAFWQIRAFIEGAFEVKYEPIEDLEIRNAVRAEHNLSLFIQDYNPPSQRVAAPEDLRSSTKANLLDVEVVAIYW
ncbi:hypothetical protein L5876_10670 [Hyphobacterium sp. SN044]|uniref:DUF6414 family protein n=1 Tax=Hyphobacterium sp. SN044 TaxID=2912575 RepID=UPI001F18BE13|nr:hypothetical protein [Hyphobacterium sp. SN044]MCF8880278.1 hypothetical protein [Hyphobacterium sp. SN044]